MYRFCALFSKKTFKKNENIFDNCLELSKLALPLLSLSHKQSTNRALSDIQKQVIYIYILVVAYNYS